MREGWTYKKLGEVCEILDSQRKPVTKKDRTKGIYPYYGASGIQDYVDSYIFDGRFLLVGEDGAKWGASDKSAFIIEGKSWVNNHAHILKISDSINDRLIEYYLTYKDLTEYISGAVVPKLTQKSLVSIPIPIPPIAEQERIVAELDLLSGIIEKKKEQLKAYDQLAQSIFYTMFGDPIDNPKGWEVKKLGRVCTFTQGIQVPVEEQHKVKREGDIQFLRIIDFTQGKEEPRYVTNKNDKYVLHEREIAIVRYGTPGFICYGKNGAIANNLFKIKPNQNDMFDFYFMLYWLRSDAFQASVKNKQYGAALQAIKFNTIQGIGIILPPLSLQEEFAEKVEAIERQKALVQQSIDETQTMFDYTMDKYFG